MTIKICRVCLRTDKTLRELEETLADYLQDICECTSNFAEHLCCSNCEESLNRNLDFRNKCLESYRILQNWKENKIKNKPPIESLHKVLIKSLNNNKEAITPEPSQQNDGNIYNANEIKLETIKDDVETEIEVVDCGTDHIHEHDDENVINEYGDDKIVDENDDDDKIVNENDDDKIVNKNDDDKIVNDNDTEYDNRIKVEFYNETNGNISHENESDEDDKFLIDCVRKGDFEQNSKKGTKTKSKSKTKASKKTNSHPRKGINEYSEYASVFDIQLFTTDEEARREVALRKFSEPYLSAKHRCTRCHTVYKYERLLHFHMKWHDPSSQFACDICGMRFITRKMAMNHKGKCHRGRFACKLCPLVTYYGGAMKSHFEKHQGKTFKCHCDRVFNHISTYLSHKRTAHASEHVCVACARTFVSARGLDTHARKAHRGERIDERVAVRCAPCGLTFASRQVYTKHVLNTDRHKDIADTLTACQYCGMSFDDSAQLKQHKRKYHPKKKDTNDVIKCKLCGASGVGRHWRWRHYSSEHPHVPYHTVTDAKTHLCHRCGKRFTNVTLMKDHLNVHSGVKPYSCGRCATSFHSAGQLARHAGSHACSPPRRTRIRRYACAKRFVNAAASGHVHERDAATLS